MKKSIVYSLMALPLLLLLANCKEPETPPTPTSTPLELSVYELEFDYDDVRVEKIVNVTGGAVDFEVSVEYADAENIGWLDAAKGDNGNTISIVVVRRNDGPEEQPREATVVVVAGEERQEIEVTQRPYVETDGEMTMPSGGLEFPFAGDEATLTKIITADSKVALTGAKTVDENGDDAQVDWITSVSVDGKVVTVSVTSNDAHESRSASVKVTNRLDGTATFTITQLAKPEVDLTGTWNWSSLNAVEDTKEGWAAATTVSGTCTITATDGGYIITGIKGNGKGLADLAAANPGATIAPMIYIAQSGPSELSVGLGATEFAVGRQRLALDLAFTLSDVNYYGAKTLYYTHKDEVSGADTPDGSGFMRISGYQKLDFPAVHSVSGATETITFATTYTGGTLKDGDGNVIPATVGYSYFNARVTGAGPMATMTAEPLDIHRNIVLTRNISR